MTYVLATTSSAALAWLAARVKPTDCAEGKPASQMSSTILFLLSFSVLFVVSAFRYDVGTDYLPIYVARFRAIANGAVLPWDPGFLALNKLIGLFTGNSAWLFVITSFFTISLTFRAIRKYSPNVALSVLIFVIGGFYFTSFNAVREWMAIALFLNAIPYIEKRDPKRYVLLVGLAACFHASALLYLPLYFVSRLKIPPVRAALFAGIAAASAGGMSFLFERIVSLTKYSWYASSSQYSGADVALADLVIGMLLMGFAYWVRYRRGSSANSDPKLDVLMNIQLCGTLIALLSPGLFMLGRVVMLMTAVQILLVPAILDRIESPLERAAYQVWIVGCYIGVCWFLFGVLGQSNVLPYRTIFGVA